MAARISFTVTRAIDPILDDENRKNSDLYALSDEILLKIIIFLPYEKHITQSLVNFGEVCVRFKGLVTDYVGRNIPVGNLARLLMESSVNPMQVRVPGNYFVSYLTRGSQDPRNPFGLEDPSKFPFKKI
ncbi:MAG: hypothetical protein KR126chlam4_00105 [Candidatus Anoxychlamydiales bacterium]|nr:hypothetical protein [Candidatus Anoxychlamydiales bacterium]NGX40288.1 hypothetical protein [Candidatus Anoxychlamydiales bacterium]